MTLKTGEVTWAPGTLDADVTYAGQNTRATITRNRQNGYPPPTVADRIRLAAGFLGAVTLGCLVMWLLF